MNSESISYNSDKATNEDIYQHLILCQHQFVPPLSMVVDIQDYSKKLREHASTVEAWDEDKLVGLIAVYCNDYDQKNAFITNVSVLPEYMRKGIAINLMNATIAFVQSSKDFDSIFLEVNKNNSKAIMLYKKCNFETINLFKDIMKMKLILKT